MCGEWCRCPRSTPAHLIVAAPEVCGNDSASVAYQQAHGKAGPSSVRLNSDVYRVWCVELFREDLVRRREGRAANYTPTAVRLCLARRDRRDLRPGPAPPACPYPTAATPPRDLAGPSPGHSRNRVLRSRPDRGSTPITRNKVCIKPSFTVNRFVGSPTPPRPGPGGLPPAATRSGVSCTTYSTQKLVRMERSPSSSAAGRCCHRTPSDYGRDLNDDLV